MTEPTPATDIERALARVRERISAAALHAGRAPAEITLVAVSKTFPAQAVRDAMAAGQRDFGENRVEEAVPKIAEIDDATAHWHLIGHLQTRKAKDAAGHFALIHSVDTLKLATAINSRVVELAPAQDILLECNISGEESKSGFALQGWQSYATLWQAFTREVEQIIALPHVRVRGLMTMAPIVEDAELARPTFSGLRALRDALRLRFPQVGWEHLSMGMSDDFEVAIAEGATLVRIGRAIFGTRHDTVG
jgi:PLP dependent protein